MSEHEPELKSLTPADFATIAALGSAIWREHYSSLVSMDQIEYMLAGRYAPGSLEKYLAATDRWMYLLWLDHRAVGYCSYAMTQMPGELKLEQLYLLPELHGHGLGSFMLRHVYAEARRLGCRTIMLTVNKGNHSSIAVYLKSGFVVRESVAFDIGNGYVMDDHVMEKQLDP